MPKITKKIGKGVRSKPVVKQGVDAANKMRQKIKQASNSKIDENIDSGDSDEELMQDRKYNNSKFKEDGAVTKDMITRDPFFATD